MHYSVELLAEQFHLIHDALFRDEIRQVVEEILIPISSMCSSIYTAQNQIFVSNNTFSHKLQDKTNYKFSIIYYFDVHATYFKCSKQRVS